MEDYPVMIKLTPMEGAGYPKYPYQIIYSKEDMPKNVPFKVLMYLGRFDNIED